MYINYLHYQTHFYIGIWVQIKKVEEQIKSLSQQQAGYQNLMTIPGIGLITSSAFMARVGNARQFSSARGMAAWLGVCPRIKTYCEKAGFGQLFT